MFASFMRLRCSYPRLRDATRRQRERIAANGPSSSCARD
jgi:hypothetical protein